MNYSVCWKQVSNEPRTFQPDFLKRLYKLDQGRIRLRWSDEFEKYVIERKVLPSTHMEYIPSLQHYKKRKDAKIVLRDSWIQAQDGYVPIDRASASAPFETRLVENLHYFNLERWGGSKGFNQALVEIESEREKRKEQEQNDRWYNIASESYDTVKWDLGERVAVPRNYTEQTCSS